MKSKKLSTCIIVDIILLASAFILRFVMVGYDFIAYTLAFAAAVFTAYMYFGRVFKIILTILLLAGVVYFIIVEIPVVSAAHTDPDPKADYVIVLGAGVNGEVPSLSLLNRLDATYAYLVKYPDAKAIVSGGQGSGENITEAECMYRWLTAKGIAPERVIKEDRATSTAENFAYSFAIIKNLGGAPNGSAFVSSEYHLYRAQRIAAAQGVAVKAVAAHTTYPFIMVNYFIREAFAVTYMRAFG